MYCAKQGTMNQLKVNFIFNNFKFEVPLIVVGISGQPSIMHSASLRFDD